MAAPSYTEDLTDIIANITSTTGWSALGGGGAGLGVGADFAMQGSNAVDKQITAAEKGMVYDNGASITNATGIHFYTWIFLATPGLADTLALRGLTMVAGTTTGAYVQFHVEGNDTYGAAGRVARCYPIRYLNTANTGSIPYRTLNGSPGANPQFFGAVANITASVKGANLGVSAIRYGTGAYLTAGEIANPATFAGFQAQNDAIANRWGILTLAGGSYELQGKFAIGRNNAGTATLCYFNDSNRNIIVPDTPHTNTDFSEIIIDHASTECYWTAINFASLGTNNPGKLTMVNMSVGEFTSCNFTDIGLTSLHTNATLTSCVWLGTDQIDANSATLTSCTISNNSNASALLVASVTEMSTITGCDFIDNTGHSIELTATGTYDFDNISFSGGGADETTTADVYNNSGGAITINVNGGSTPTVRNSAGSTTTIVAGAVTLAITVQNTAGTKIQNARVLALAGSGGAFPFEDVVTITRSGSTATVSHTAHGMVNGNSVVIENANQNEYNGVKVISNVTTNSYDYTVSGTPTTPATGTILATAALISGLTDVNGNISDTRTYSVNQPLGGRVRKSTSSPYYKSANVVGTINKDNGLALTIVMLSDE